MSNVEFLSRNELAADEAELIKTALETQELNVPIEGFLSLLRVSGLYSWSSKLPFGSAQRPVAIQPSSGPELEAPPQTEAVSSGEALLPIIFQREELRIDVDGNYPQMTASGTLYRDFLLRVHWIARLTPVGPNLWSGSIWYKDGAVGSFPYTSVKVHAIRSLFPALRGAVVTFSGGGATARTRAYRFVSPYFQEVEFEYDHEAGLTPELQVDTCAHPNHPASLPCQNLTVETVFRRSGFNARRNPATTSIPNDGPDPGAQWSDAEMHDAMQIYWSHFANKPQWALWVLFAKQHDQGNSLGGIMFDDIGPNHRQGTAIFYDSFISEAPPGDPAPAAAVTRLHFWTAVHEMGHAFNLAHSWQKSLGPPWGTPWLPLVDEPEARSFMNYPYGVSGGESAFFSDFEYRFSDGELLFMRHAPERFVEMGNADWFDHHGFEGPKEVRTPSFAVEIGVNRTQPTFDFLEPVVLEVRLTNISPEPKIVPSDVLLDTGRMVVVLKKDGKPARRWAPYATHCRKPTATVLQPGQQITESLFVSAGVNGWDLAEPGLYTVQMAMEVDGIDLRSNALRLRVTPPKSYDEEYVAQDIHTDTAGRVMAFDGSLALDDGVNSWRELIARLPASKAAAHARIALALPLTRNYRVLRIDASPEAASVDSKSAFAIAKAKPDEASKLLGGALVENAEAAVATLGRVDYEYYGNIYAGWLKESGADKEAKQVGDTVKKAAAAAKSSYPAAKSVIASKAAAE